jgi:hypothetical protein
MTVTLTPAQVLEAAIRSLDERGWTRGSVGRVWEGEACLVGHLVRGAYDALPDDRRPHPGTYVSGYVHPEPPRVALEGALGLVHAAVGGPPGASLVLRESRVIVFNDAAHDSIPVRDALTRALAAAREAEARA